MGIFDNTRLSRGFTIVEVIVAIVVIGILAGIVLVAYPNYQRHMRNNERKNDLTQLAAALNAYALKNNNYIESGSGCGFSGSGNGWATQSDGGSYPKAVTKCLEEGKFIVSADKFVDPSGCRWDSGGDCGSYTGSSATVPTRAYMKAVCTKNGKKTVYLFAYLEGEPRRDTEIDSLCEPGSLEGFNPSTQKWGTNYGMNYYVSVK